MFNMFTIVLGAHVRHRAFATQIELYCVDDYDGKWSTIIHKDGMLGIFLIRF